MMVMTAKVNFKKIAIILAAAVGVILATILLFGGNDDATPTAAGTVSDNDSRVAFLESFGWDVTTSPLESSQVRIPNEESEVFERYNALQKSQGYDLTAYAGKNVMRYVYQINNYPGATQKVYATLLSYKDQVIGGDITDTAPGGQIRGFRMPEGNLPGASQETSTPTAGS